MILDMKAIASEMDIENSDFMFFVNFTQNLKTLTMGTLVIDILIIKADE
jgi:hypothetical protein